MSSGFNEQGLSTNAESLHRALASLQEELEAVDYYNQRADRTEEGALKAVLLHNRNEEIEHAAMLLEWLRRTLPEFNEAMKTYIFTQKPITDIEAAATGGESRGDSLGIGNVK